jgi:hypothetical protein
MPGRLVFSTTADGANTPTERMRIDSSGRLGLGTSTVRSILNIAAASDPTITIENTDTSMSASQSYGRIDWYGNDASTNAAGVRARIDAIETTGQGATDIAFSTTVAASTTLNERVRITSAGLVGIGTTSPAANLELGTVAAANQSLRINSAGNNYLELSTTGATGEHKITAGNSASGTAQIIFETASGGTESERARIDSSGRLGLGTSAPWSKLTVGSGGTANPAADVTIHDSTIDQYRLKLTSVNYNANTKWLGIGLGYSDNYLKAGIIAEAVDNNARSNLHFCLNNAASSANASLSDSRMVITSAGLVGIGTTAPSQLLHVSGGYALLDGLRIKGTDTANSIFQSAAFGLSTNNYITFAAGTGEPERMRLDSSGRLLVGTSTSRSTNSTECAIQLEGTSSAASSFSITRNSNDAGRPFLYFAKSRGTANGSNTAVSSGDFLGSVVWCGANGSDTNSIAAEITAAVDGEVGTAGDTSDMPGRLVFSTTADGANTPTERMRIDSSGRLGLGTSSPATELVVSATSNPVLRLNNATNAVTALSNIGGIEVYTNDASTNGTGIKSFIRTIAGNFGAAQGDASLTFGTASLGAGDAVERVRIDASGNVGIGSTAPSYPLTVKGSIGLGVASNGTVELSFDNSIVGDALSPAAAIQGLYTAYGSTSAGALIFKTNSAAASATEKARIDSSGRLLVGTSTSTGTGATFQIRSDSAVHQEIFQSANNTGGSSIILCKSRGTAASPTVVNSGDYLGIIRFRGHDGTDYDTSAAEIAVQVDGTPGANDMPGRLVFSTTADGASSPTERMRINSNGTASIYSVGDPVLGARSSRAAGSTDTIIAGYYSSTSTSDGTLSFRVYTNGNVQNTNNSYGAISDIKLKENIVDANSQWDDLKALQVRKFNFKEGQTHTQIGLIAQEVELVSPGLVNETPDRDEDGNETGEVTKGVNYSVLYMKAVKALQEAMERIEQLETSNSDLLARVTALEAS